MPDTPRPDPFDAIAHTIVNALRREEGHGPQRLAEVVDELETKICAEYWRQEEAAGKIND